MNPADTQALPVVLVTGSARRIGAAIASHFHTAGFAVVIHAHTHHAEAQQLVAAMNTVRAGSAHFVQGDLCLPDTPKKLVDAVEHAFGRLDVLVNNASRFEQTEDAFSEAAQTMFALHVKAPWALSHAAWHLLQQHEGAIVNITDIHAARPLRGYGLYCQSKAALAMQTQVLACEFAPAVRVNAVAPGAIAWPEGHNMLSAEQQAKILKKTPLARHGEPGFVAEAVFALASNRFVTGQTLAVDGGRSI